MSYISSLLATARTCSKQTGRCSAYHCADMVFSYLLHGCTFREYQVGEFYRLRGFDRKKVVTYRRWREIIEKFNSANHIHILENKVDFNKYFQEFENRKWIYSKETNHEELSAFVKCHNSLIVKPIDMMQGQGIHIVDCTKAPDTIVDELLKQDCLIEEVIEQNERMSFNSKSVNTIRLFTVLDRNNIVHVIKAILRVGVGDSVVDNYCAGGVIYPINEKTGVIEEKGQNKNMELFVSHPGGGKMLGYQLSKWDECLEFVSAAAKHIPEVRFVGWDVAVTNNGFELIEGNHNPDLEFLEFIGRRQLYKEIMSYL